jgi:hypothetical protein
MIERFPRLVNVVERTPPFKRAFVALNRRVPVRR